MSYGLFNWWWGENESVVSDKWDTLFILKLEKATDGSYTYLWNTLSTLETPKESWVIYDSRICSYEHEIHVARDYGKWAWDWLVENHPLVASLLRNEPCLIVVDKAVSSNFGTVAYNPVSDILRLTEAEFKQLFVQWEGLGWWILKDPELNRKVGRILKQNSPEKYAKFRSLSGGKIQ